MPLPVFVRPLGMTGQTIPATFTEWEPDMERLTTEQMREQYEVLGFAFGFVIVRRKSDNVQGTLDFDHAPRFYYNFQPV